MIVNVDREFDGCGRQIAIVWPLERPRQGIGRGGYRELLPIPFVCKIASMG
jgi:hypothetical protein